MGPLKQLDMAVRHNVEHGIYRRSITGLDPPGAQAISHVVALHGANHLQATRLNTKRSDWSI